MFLWTGLLTVVFGIICFFFLPNTPLTAWFLKSGDRILAVERIAVNQQGIKNKKWKKYQLLEPFKDIAVYCYMIFLIFSMIPPIEMSLLNFLSGSRYCSRGVVKLFQHTYPEFRVHNTAKSVIQFWRR